MNIFAGNIVLNGNKTIDGLDFDFVESIGKSGNKIIYVFGETEKKSSKELIDFFTEKFGELVFYDISISKEERVEIVNGTYEEGVYELATFEGEEVEFDEIFERFSEFEEVVSIREAEVSKKYGNRIVKVDFVY